MTNGQVANATKHTVIPRIDVRQPEHQPGEVVNYQLNQEELAKYRAIPTVSERWSVFRIPMRGKKS
jgi:hypothetical protein